MRTNRTLAATVLALCVAGCFAPSAAMAQATLTAKLVDIANDVSDPFNSADTEPSIAVNPKNLKHIAVVAFSGNWDPHDAKLMAPVWHSSDGGKTWKRVNQIPRPKDGLGGPGDQKIAFDANGKLYVAELADGSPPRCYIYRQDGGTEDPLTPGATFGDDQPHLSADTGAASPCAKMLYSPWLDFGQPHERSTVTVSNDGGATITTIGVGDNSTLPNRTTRVAVGSQGEVYMIYKTWETFTGGGDFVKATFRVQRSDDCGKTWAKLGASGVSVHGATPVETFFTTAFGNPSKGPVGRARSSDAWIAVSATSGDVYAVYVSKDTSSFGQIFVARSTDKGQSWKSARVTDGKNHSAFPEIAVADNGTVGVLYIDYDDSGPKTIFRHRFARSFDDGKTWTDQILQAMDPSKLSNAFSGFLWGDYEGLTAQGNTFLGVFTGESIGRTTLQLDPIFFSETAEPPVKAPRAAYLGCRGGHHLAGATGTGLYWWHHQEWLVNMAFGGADENFYYYVETESPKNSWAFGRKPECGYLYPVWYRADQKKEWTFFQCAQKITPVNAALAGAKADRGFATTLVESRVLESARAHGSVSTLRPDVGRVRPGATD